MKTYSLAALLCLAGLLLAPAAPAVGDGPADLVETLRTSVVRIGLLEPGRPFVSLGTGFFVDDACTVATAHHVVGGRARLSVQAPLREGEEPRYGRAEILKSFERNDVAFLRVDLGDAGCGAYTHLPPPPRILQTELNGAEVLIAGFPSLEGGLTPRTPVYRRGIVASGEFGVPIAGTTVPMYLLDLTGIPGFSGSPVVLTDSGQVIGVVHGPRRTDREFDLEWAAPLFDAQYRSALATGSE